MVYPNSQNFKHIFNFFFFFWGGGGGGLWRGSAVVVRGPVCKQSTDRGSVFSGHPLKTGLASNQAKACKQVPSGVEGKNKISKSHAA